MLSASENVAHVLRQRIADGVFEVGTQLPAEHQLMESFGVSRPTCREALRILQSEGLVVVQRGNRGGARVLPPDPMRIASYAGVYLQMRGASISEIFDVRIAIEPEAVALIARRPDSQVLSLLAQNVASQRFLVDDRPAFYKCGRDFRQLLLDHCGSETLRLLGLVVGEIADQQLSLLSHALPYRADQADDFRRSIVMKQNMIAAMEQKDVESAAEIWRAYLRFFLDALFAITPPDMRDMKPFPLG
jgi:DNA-binding FadR family transcriptional regulator